MERRRSIFQHAAAPTSNQLFTTSMKTHGYGYGYVTITTTTVTVASVDVARQCIQLFIQRLMIGISPGGAKQRLDESLTSYGIQDEVLLAL